MKQVNKKHSRMRKMAALLVVVIIAFASVFIIKHNQTLKAGPKSDLKAGEVRVTKTAKPVEGMVNQWEIEVKVEAQNEYPPPGNDVMLVIDTSGSMKDLTGANKDGPSRMKVAQDAANQLVTQLLDANPDNRIGIVTYNTKDDKTLDYTSSKTTLHNFINGLEGKGATHTQLGIHRGAEKMKAAGERDDSNGKSVHRSMILISDGVPTLSAKPISGNWGYPYKDGTTYMNFIKQGNIENRKERTYYFETEFGMESFDYTQIIGNPDTAKDIRVEIPDSDLPAISADIMPPEVLAAHPPYDPNNMWGTHFPHISYTRRDYNHGHAAIAEADLIKAYKFDSGEKVIDEIYSVGLDLFVTKNEDQETIDLAKKTLKKIASSEGNHYLATSEDIKEILKDIGSKISYAVHDSYVIDPMGEGFEVVGDAKVNIGTVDREDQTLTWKIGDSVPNEDEGLMVGTMKYQVKATDDVFDALDKDGFAATNGTTTMKYTKNGENKETDFVVPKVKPVMVTLKKELYDDKSQLVPDSELPFNIEISGDGITGSLKHTVKPKDGTIQVINAWKAGTDYTITEKLNPGDDYFTSIIVNGNVVKGTSATFNFGNDSSKYTDQTIVVKNSKTEDQVDEPVKLHVRQAIRTANGEVVVPDKGYFNSRTLGEQDRFSLTSASAKEAGTVTQDLFTSYELKLDKNDLKLRVDGVVPEYYSIYGYTLTTEATDLSKHVSTDSALQKVSSVELDYETAEEYWLTLFLDSTSDSPGLHNWDYELNDFGQITKP